MRGTDFLKLYKIGKSILSHDTPHFVDIRKGIKALEIMIIEGALRRHFINIIGLFDKTKSFGKLQLRTIHFFQRNAKEFLEVGASDPCGIGCPEKPVYHALTLCKSECQGCGRFFFIYAVEIAVDVESVDFK